MSNNNSKRTEFEDAQLKQQQVFDTETLDSGKDQDVKGSQSFTDVEFICETNLAKLPETIDELESIDKLGAKPKKISMLAKLSLLALILVVIVQTIQGLQTAYLQSPWLFGFYVTVAGIIMAWAGAITLSEWKKLIKLKHVADTQATGERLALSMQRGEASKFISPLLQKYPDTEGKKQYLAINSVEHNDAEMVMLFDELVLSERDEKAKKIVSRFAAESALLLAASPLAVLDMAIILWRNQRMVNVIADVYGIELGYWSRIKLIKSIVLNIVYAGTTEVVTDLGTQLLSVEMTGKLSARLAQGLGGGLLTARLGYQAMSLCRPLTFKAQNRPKLSQVHQQLLGELKSFSASVMKTNKNKQKQTVEK
ncbi:TIGR01620 family protein [Shewanella sp. 10N.286.48.A6]|uniref:TIGR01620 family protein n=1 Tax=Shewanella sp. 10N.286.48.A6 TaxID=1880833 RepID=UPI000C81A4D5|nr:TIGR01620 family protein [Shewanella sp. 10N.286.48.A6]PMI01769.1 TIGR01620 family protein [Shewanella sp. 10N.286.48.A6]